MMEYEEDNKASIKSIISCEDIDSIKEDILNRFTSSLYDDPESEFISFSDDSGSMIDSRNNNRKNLTTTTKKSRKRKFPKKENKIRTERQTIRNERERHRKARLNAGFNVLRKTIIGETGKKSSEDRLTQLQTLQVAAQYIANMTEMIRVNDRQYNQGQQHHQGGQCYCFNCMDY